MQINIITKHYITYEDVSTSGGCCANDASFINFLMTKVGAQVVVSFMVAKGVGTTFGYISIMWAEQSIGRLATASKGDLGLSAILGVF